MTNLIAKGRELGYTPAQVRAMTNEQRLYKEVLDCETIEDIKILLMYWIEQGKIK
jgi:hypothetical protein